MMRMRWRARSGFTLIELMVVMVILGILVAAILPNVIGKREKANVTKAKTDIFAIENFLQQFYLDVGRYPTEEEGLRVLYYEPEDDADKWGGPYPLKPIPKDPWGREYVYRCPGVVTNMAYEVLSYGKDGEEGGEDEDADITSWGEFEDEE